MSELAKAVDTIQREFRERFGLEVDIQLNVHEVPQIEKAESVAKIVAKELELCRPECESHNDSAWLIAERRGVTLVVFYPKGVLQCEQL